MKVPGSSSTCNRRFAINIAISQSEMSAQANCPADSPSFSRRRAFADNRDGASASKTNTWVSQMITIAGPDGAGRGSHIAHFRGLAQFGEPFLRALALGGLRDDAGDHLAAHSHFDFLALLYLFQVIGQVLAELRHVDGRGHGYRSHVR